jgi:hypothetical protein
MNLDGKHVRARLSMHAKRSSGGKHVLLVPDLSAQELLSTNSEWFMHCVHLSGRKKAMFLHVLLSNMKSSGRVETFIQRNSSRIAYDARHSM